MVLFILIMQENELENNEKSEGTGFFSLAELRRIEFSRKLRSEYKKPPNLRDYEESENDLILTTKEEDYIHSMLNKVDTILETYDKSSEQIKMYKLESSSILAATEQILAELNK